jgi:flavin-dependent dehydrogenase
VEFVKPIVVIGAGPAGSVASILLSRSGLHVILIEQHRFPRDKVCGECVSALGIDVLQRLDAIDRMARHEPIHLRRTMIHAADGSSINIPLPRPMLGLSRLCLDDELLHLAIESGAQVMQPARCEQIDSHHVIVRNLASNERRVIDASVIVVADGKAALLPQRPNLTSDFGIKAHFAAVNGPRDAIELFGARGHYGGLAPVEGERWNASFSVPAARLQEFRADLDELFASIVDQHLTLRTRMRGARRVGPWLAAPLPRFGVNRNWPHGVIPLGNAAAAIEPIGGEGIGLAMRSAELAAEAIIDAVHRGAEIDIQRLRESFNSLWRPRRAACRALAMAISCPGLASWAVPMIASTDPPTRLALRLIGGK